LIFKSKHNNNFSKEKKIEGKVFNLTKVLFSENITFSKYNFSFISNDEKDKKILEDLVKSEINWNDQENDINNNIIKIINNNEKYKIELIQNEKAYIFNRDILSKSYIN